MDKAELRALLAAEYSDALAAQVASKLSKARSDSVDYYLGNMANDMPTPDGRSGAVSMDVADTIEGMMPQLMEIFTGSDEVVQFDPQGPEDVQEAQQETDYVNHVFMNQNPGFLVLYSFIKDALLEKVGVVKFWWETREQEQRETYLDQTDDAYALIMASPDIEVVEHSERPDPNAPPPQPGFEDQPQPMIHDVTVVMKKTHAQAKVMGVPPEEFGIERGARSIADCNYCFHKVVKTESQLIEQGFDEKQCKRLPTFYAWTNPEEISRDTVDEHATQTGGSETNDAARRVEIIEHYCRMDYDGDGKANLYRVTTAGRDGEILKRDGKEDIELFDTIPFAAITPIIITHRFFGRSIADLVMDIQRIKTALLRGALDNLYLHNNPRVEVAETFANENTLDDLLVSRPGGIVRTKQPGGIQWQVVPDITGAIYPALEYFDATREWRTGVTRQGQGIDANALQNQSATAVAQAYSASQARVKLIARIFAETGIKDLFIGLHGLIRKHGEQQQTARLRNQWVAVDPRNWKTRNDLTVNVGLGTGSKQQQLGHVMAIIGLQKEAMANGLTNLVSVENLYNSAKEITKLLGHKDVDAFFTDPKTQPPLQPKPDPKLQEIAAKADVEKLQAQADIATQNAKTQAEIALAERRFQLDSELMRQQMAMKHDEHKMNMTAHVVKAASASKGPNGETLEPHPVVTQLINELRKANAPKRIIRGPDGKVAGVAPVEH